MTSRRITIVASELLGRAGTGGAGTADSLLAVALGRHGHDVKLVIATGRDIGTLSDEWSRIYEDAGVEVVVLNAIRGVRPDYLAPTFEVFQALRDDPPDVAIVNDWRGLGFAALRARQTGIALTETAFAVHCHGPGRVLTEFAQKVPNTLERFGEQVIERASLELADAAVSPSEWLLDWLREHQWPLPSAAHVIPYVRQSAALDQEPNRATNDTPVRRLAFFGQLREGKGIRIFIESLAALDENLIDGVELLFLGSARGRWSTENVEAALPAQVKDRLADIRFEGKLDREAALAELRRTGTLAVMPSLLDNAPNTVSECIECGVPFIATATGGIPELVAGEDHARVLCAPTAPALAAALTRALTARPAFVEARAPRESRPSVDAWLELVDDLKPPPPRAGRPAVKVAVVAIGDDAQSCAQRLGEHTRTVDVEVVHADSRRGGLFRTAVEWIVFLDNDDDPHDGMIDALVAAQAASGADAVTCAVTPAHTPDEVQLFVGDPGALGLVENQYGVVGLLRSSLAIAGEIPERGDDPDWPLFARVALDGAHIVSLPVSLASHRGRPGKVSDVPGEGLQVLETFEEHAKDPGDLPQLVAVLAAALERYAVAPPRHEIDPAGGPIRRRIAFLGSARKPR